jgi:gliding motility-associated-like protein
LFILLLLAYGFVGFAQAPVAGITATPLFGCAPLAVSFTDASSNSPNAWTWNFGGTAAQVTPQTSTQQNTAALYLVPGTYTVTHTATNASGTSQPVTVTITVYPVPTADFTEDKQTGCFPTTVNFTNTSTAGGSGATISSFIWDFGDGHLDSTDVNPSHTYTTGGSFPVTLAVRNNYGCNGKAQVKNVAGAIVLTGGVFPDFTAAVNSTCTLPVSTTFTNQTTGPPLLSYIWDFGDGSGPDNTGSPTHSYTAAGSYKVLLTASSSQGCQDTVSTVVNISATGNISDFTGAGNVCINSQATFKNTSSPSPSSAVWDYGDGSPLDNSINGQHTYTTAGTFTVTLTNTFAGCTGTVSKTVNVVNAPVPAFIGTNTSSCKAPLSTQFTDQTVGATTWLWNFGDGSTSNLQNPTHSFTTQGSFAVSLTTSIGGSCANILVKPAFVNIAAPIVTLSNGYGCAPFVFTPVFTATAVDGVTSYAWDFGNGFTFNGQTPPPQTYAAGVYNISLTITTSGGCTATATATVKVGSTQPTPLFTASPTTQCVGQPIQFTDQSTGGADQWLWDFGDGGTSTLQNPIYTYTKPGTYDVTLTAYNQGCLQSLKKTAFITINPPLADFSFTAACGQNNNFTFTDKSTGPVSTWLWDFGDGTTYSGQTPPAHVFPAGSPQVYNVSLTVTNGACSNTKTYPVNANQGTVLVFTPNQSCINTNIIFTATTPPANYSFLFVFGDGKTTSGFPASVVHAYTKAGIYQAKAITTDLVSGCIDSSNTVTVTVLGPTAKFTTPTVVSCGVLNAVFTDQSTVPAGSSITSWAWDYGDGSTATGQAPGPHSYAFQGIFPVKLSVIDNNGCSDSLTIPNYITVSIPVAKFSTDDSNYCPASNIKFNNLSTGGFNPVYTWDFKDGTTYTGPNPPLHNFPVVGKYPVSLSITDAYSCTSTYSAPSPINIDVPVASFTLSAAYSACPPLNEAFTFTGSYAASYTWNFDNGGSAIIANPGSIYTQPGDYDPKLTITSPGGCVASATHHIHIDGPIGALTYSPLAACDSVDVNFNVTTSNVITFIWNYNDGQVDTTYAPVSSITHHYDIPGSFTPFVTLVDAAGCHVTNFGTNQVEIDHITKTDFTVDDSVLCDNGIINFTNTSLVGFGTTITNYTWNYGDGSPINSGTSPTASHNYPVTGLYNASLNITTLGGCTGTVTKPMTVSPSPKVAINGLISQCEPAVLNFSGTETVPNPYGPLTWSWDFGNGQTATGQNPAPVSYPKAGEYVVRLIATNTVGCKDTTDTTPPSHLFIYPIPAVNAGADTTICLGTPLQLNATGAATTYNWLPPVNGAVLSCLACASPVADPVPTSTYFIVNGTSINGCQAKDTINVTVNVQPTVSISGPDSVCLGQGTQLTATGAAIYSWTPSEGLSDPNIGNPIAKPDASQAGSGDNNVITYQVTGYDSKKCFSDTKSVNVTVFNNPVINLPANVTINVGSSYQMNPTVTTNIVSYNWAPNNNLSCTTCQTPVATPTITTKYDFTATNDGGCATTDSIRIQVICNGANFFVPNTFSPNGDGVNDHFVVNGVGLNVIPSITIYNRWGQIVFQKSNFPANSPADAWDGTFNGQPAPSDVYVYTIQILCNNATLIPYHGNVTLIR